MYKYTLKSTMSDKHIETPRSSVTLPPLNEEYLATLDPDMQDFVRRQAENYAKIYDPTVEQNLRNLHETGDESAFNAELEDIVYSVLEDQPEYLNLMNELREVRSRRGKPEEESKITSRIKELDAHYRKLILSITGLLDEKEQASARIASILDAKLSEEDKSNPDKVMMALNILVNDEEAGKMTYRFPSEIMPESVNKLWGAYMANIGDFNRAVKTLRESGDISDRDALIEVDARRKRIHDELAKAFQAAVGLTDEQGWDYQSTRKRIAIIRDREFSHYAIDTPRNAYEATRTEKHNAKMHNIIADNDDTLAVLAKLSAKKKQR